VAVCGRAERGDARTTQNRQHQIRRHCRGALQPTGEALASGERLLCYPA
jgi:hypothetical protein